MTKLEMLFEAEGYGSVEGLRTAKPAACSLGIYRRPKYKRVVSLNCVLKIKT